MGTGHLCRVGWVASLAIRRATLGENLPDTATSYNNIGLAFKSKGQYDHAIENFKKDLAIRRATLGKNHPDTLRIIPCLGDCRSAKVASC